MPVMPATILVVEDEPSIRTSMSLVLAESGYIVRNAEDGFSALSEIRREIPDIMLSDLNMPGMSGFELLSVVRQRFPAIQTIAMSGAFSGNEVPAGLAADAFYPKGGALGPLWQTIQKLLQAERRAPQPASPIAPVSVHRNGHDSSPEASITIACPECLRTFPLALDDSIDLYARRNAPSAAYRSTLLSPNPLQGHGCGTFARIAVESDSSGRHVRHYHCRRRKS